MGSTTAIEWTDATVNFWHGCKKVSPGCKFCYMYRDKARYGQDPMKVVRSAPATFNAALKWAEPKRIFTCSWSDFFIDEADEWREAAWDIIRRTPQHSWQILTKRPERILDHLPADWGDGWENVWLGVSVESQKYAEERIPYLLDVPAQTKFLSCEPLLGPLDLTDLAYEHPGPEWSGQNKLVDWIITGGESGAKDKIRPAELDWFRSIRDQCQEAGVAYFHKQHGGSSKIDSVWGGRILDGRTWDEMPELEFAAR